MTDNEQRIVIAEACGWREVVLLGGQVLGFPCLDSYLSREVPDYLNDLNAMHEAEKTLNGNHQRIANYQDALIRVVGITGFGPFGTIENWLLHATARQRTEAFLRTLGKWKE
jgi:hypothetical protein